MAVGWGEGRKEGIVRFCPQKQLYHFTSDMNQLDEVREWEKREKKKVGILYIS